MLYNIESTSSTNSDNRCNIQSLLFKLTSFKILYTLLSG